MKREYQDRLVLCMAMIEIGEPAEKQEVLSQVEKSGYYRISDSDREWVKGRKEPKWKNALAFTSKHLEEDGYLDKPRRGVWRLIDDSMTWLHVLDLCREAVVAAGGAEKLTPEMIRRAKIYLDQSSSIIAQ